MNATKSLSARDGRSMSSFTPNVRTSLSDRRTNHRGPIQSKARLIVTDALGIEQSYEIMSRESAAGEQTFLLRETLSVGQSCRIEFEPAKRKFSAEVVRSRAISAGRYEMTIELRKTL